MEVVIGRNYNEMSKLAAQMAAELLNTKLNAVLGMATGSTPLGLYQELVRMYKQGQLDFSRVMTFNLDEYVGLPGNHPQSYAYFMQENFFRHVNVPPHNINVPSGTTSNYPAFCDWYEKRITECGGIDLQILGIGMDRADPHRDGIDRHVLAARQLMLVASSKTKAKAIAQAVEGPVTSMVTASALQLHRDAIVIVDDEAAAGLTMRDYYDFIYAAKPAAPRA